MKANERLVLDMFLAVEQRDLDRLLAIFDPDVEFVWPPSLPGYGGTYRGQEVLDMNTAFASAWDPMQPTDEARPIHARVIGSNDVEVVVHYHQRGVDPSGRTCDTEVLGLYRVDGGKVTRLQMFYFDPEHVASFLTAADQSAP
ncbi:MAG: nuclear transport factor 2 family protein [Acidimicrobiales bacterium]